MGLAVLVGAIGRAVINREESPRALKDLLAYCLVTVLPVIFLRAAVQAWRLQPKGIESIAAGFLLFGLGGAIFSLAQSVLRRLAVIFCDRGRQSLAVARRSWSGCWRAAEEIFRMMLSKCAPANRGPHCARRARADSRLVPAGGRRKGATENKPKITYVHPDPRSQLAGR